MNANFRFSIDDSFKHDLQEYWSKSCLGFYNLIFIALSITQFSAGYLAARGNSDASPVLAIIGLIFLTAILTNERAKKLEAEKRAKSAVDLEAALMLLESSKHSFSNQLLMSLSAWNNESNQLAKEQLEKQCATQFDTEIHNLVEQRVKESNKPMSEKERLSHSKFIFTLADYESVNLKRPTLVRTLVERSALLGIGMSEGNVRAILNKALDVRK